MKSKTLGLIAFISIFLTALCWTINLICQLINKIGNASLSTGKIGGALTLISSVCSIVVLLVAAYEWVKTQKTSVKVIYWVIAILAILSVLGVSIYGFSL